MFETFGGYLVSELLVWAFRLGTLSCLSISNIDEKFFFSIYRRCKVQGAVWGAGHSPSPADGGKTSLPRKTAGFLPTWLNLRWVKKNKSFMLLYLHFSVVSTLRLTLWSAAPLFRPTAPRPTAATPKTRGPRWWRSCSSGSWFTPGDTKPPRLTESQRPEISQRQQEEGEMKRWGSRGKKRGWINHETCFAAGKIISSSSGSSLNRCVCSCLIVWQWMVNMSTSTSCWWVFRAVTINWLSARCESSSLTFLKLNK